MTSPLPTRLADTDLAVTTQDLSKRYRKQTALNGVSLQVPRGAFYLLVGPNGAGKSTLLKILLDLVRADAGHAELFGLDVQRQGPAARANVGYVPERTEWGYGWMRVGRLLEHHAQYFPAWDYNYAARLADKFQLRLDRQMAVLSKGQARRVHLTMALAHRPPLLLLDEPTDGLDPLMRDETLGVLADHLSDSPSTVLVSTHHVEEVERLADHIGVLRDGELHAQLSLAVLQRDLRSYRVEVPEGWHGVPALNGAVLSRVTAVREVQWTVWGDESDIVRQFAAANGTVREARAVSLLDATVAMLSRPESRI
ncbi:MAG TPA: ABC transporter ATP-binding protein [Gemmatimonadaceae bacterium]|jgi:ABC-2 type transport system ATP-binding protein|nr:ABC transporter ATP-binding protein [Gemmatimonadaceae bacterium]